MQHAERHDDVESVIMEWELLAASVVQHGPERLSLRAEFADRLHALNLKVGTPLPEEPDGSASPRSDIQDSVRSDNMK
jgi:hypothetical protein